MKPVLSPDYDPLHDDERLWTLLTIADFASADGEYYLQVIGRLQTAARRAYFTGLDDAGAHDIAVDAFERARRAATDGKLRRDGNVAGYVMTAARNAALSELRRRQGREHVNFYTLSAGHLRSDDDVADYVARTVERHATAELFADVLRRAVENGDATVVRLVTYLLNETDKTGTVPSNRSAATALGLSHTGVAKARERLRLLLEDSGGGHPSLTGGWP